ncbi:MAG: hypothetical protein H7Y31_00005 [Chitinophagaceae bacterium]|nr:hypothetical protein [Chitinophagaceae bacterium]
MKRVFIFLLCTISISANAQFSTNSSSINLAAGWVQDFPGLSGIGLTGEYRMSIADGWEGGVGAKRLIMKGFPRTASAEEYTKSTTIDFNLYYLPLNTESNIVRVGAGYAFSFYQIRRSFPVTATIAGEKQTSWPVQDNKGRTSGMSVMGEYEHLFYNSNLSLGVRAAWYKAYDRVIYVGPFVNVRLGE